MLAAGHDVRVVYIGERFGVDFSQSDDAALCDDVRKVRFAGFVSTLRRWLGGMSVSQAWCGSSEAKNVILQLSAGADVVWVEHLRGVGMLPSTLNCPVIWDAVDALGPLFAGRARLVQNLLKYWVFHCEAMRTGREEARLAARFSATIAVTEREAALLGPNVTAIENGVDCDYFQPSQNRESDKKLLHICMVGRWNYLPNSHGCVQFLRDVWPEICLKFPEAVCTIIGPGCQAGSPIADAANDGSRARNVVLVGPVLDVRPYLHQSLLSVCPVMLAAGMQNKILESIACGVPVVCTDIAAAGTIPGGLPGVFPASKPSEMIDIITNLMADPESAQLQGLMGRDLVASTMTWKPSYAKVAMRLEQVLHP
jgi:glycosyltransferase involved in cell wall biosynthesis